MFSGIIQDVGKILSIIKSDNFIRVSIQSNIKGYKIGSSICCSGICLTVTSKSNKNTFTVDVSPETLEKTNALPGFLQTRTEEDLLYQAF